jgi:hypothetical protein
LLNLQPPRLNLLRGNRPRTTEGKGQRNPNERHRRDRRNKPDRPNGPNKPD